MSGVSNFDFFVSSLTFSNMFLIEEDFLSENIYFSLDRDI